MKTDQGLESKLSVSYLRGVENERASLVAQWWRICLQCRSGSSPARGSGNLLQYSCLETPRRQRNLVSYSPKHWKETPLKWLSTHAENANLVKRLKNLREYTHLRNLSSVVSLENNLLMMKARILVTYHIEKLFGTKNIIPNI